MGQSRNEDILENILGAENEIGEPQSRIEELLQEILAQGQGGGLPQGTEPNQVLMWSEGRSDWYIGYQSECIVGRTSSTTNKKLIEIKQARKEGKPIYFLDTAYSSNVIVINRIANNGSTGLILYFTGVSYDPDASIIKFHNIKVTYNNDQDYGTVEVFEKTIS